MSTVIYSLPIQNPRRLPTRLDLDLFLWGQLISQHVGFGVGTLLIHWFWRWDTTDPPFIAGLACVVPAGWALRTLYNFCECSFSFIGKTMACQLPRRFHPICHMHLLWLFVTLVTLVYCVMRNLFGMAWQKQEERTVYGNMGKNNKYVIYWGLRVCLYEWVEGRNVN